jgi:hypothetical protein
MLFFAKNRAILTGFQAKSRIAQPDGCLVCLLAVAGAIIEFDQPGQC